MKKLLLITLVIFISQVVFAQYNDIKMRGDNAFKAKDYYTASNYYKQLIDGKYSYIGKVPFYSRGKVDKKELRADYPYICYQLGECYRLIRDYSEAQKWYNKVLTGNFGNDYPLARFWYATCLRTGKNFDEAIVQLRLFITNYKGDKKFRARAEQELLNCQYAKQQYQLHPATQVTRMQKQWNAGNGDYALIKNNGHYWFTSSRLKEKNGDHINRIYSAIANSTAEPVQLNFIEEGKKNIQYSTPSVTASGKRMYLTRWYTDGAKTVLAIFFATLENNTWSGLKKLGQSVNQEGYHAIQPFVTPDGKRLYFASDKPGGQGGYDIWLSDLDNTGNALNANNLGNTINTADDEQAPFYDPKNKRLVFSSTGFTGLGGFDFFESYENNGRWALPQNLGYPINSAKDDLYYFDDPDDQTKFYISSDRESDCCLSLYDVKVNPQFIKGKITDCDSQAEIAAVTVSLIDSTSGGSVKELQTSQNTGYSFRIAAGFHYKLIFKKEGYFSKSIPVNLATQRDSLIRIDACLQAFKINKAIVIKNILYDFNSADLRTESKTALDAIVILMQDNPSIKIEIRSHTDAIGNDAANLNLSQNRAESCVYYLLSKGTKQDRLLATGFGASSPVASNTFPNGKDNPAGRQLNRRTEFVVKSQ